jgi:LPS export ABC transporter protein LptC
VGLDASPVAPGTVQLNWSGGSLKMTGNWGSILFLKHIKISPQLIFLCASVHILFSAGCKQKKDILPVAEATIDVPYQEFSNSTLYFYTDNYMQWKLQSKQMRKPVTDTGSIMVTPVKLTLFDSSGAVSTFVLADSGIIKNSMESYNIWGDVYIRTRDSMIIRSQRLIWKKDRRRVESNTYVQIETKKGDKLRGKGLDATEDFSYFKFLSDVKGTFPDFKRRVESKEENVF